MKSKDEFCGDKTVEAQWCYDSETGERVLIDIRTNKVLAYEHEIFDDIIRKNT